MTTKKVFSLSSNLLRVGVGAICFRDGKVLMLRRAYAHGSGSWSTPGGHIEFGESPESTAIRETREETSVTVSDPQFIAITNDIFKSEGKHYITIWMKVQYVSGEASLTAPEESTEIGWFDWDLLPQPLFIPMQNLMAGKHYPSDHNHVMAMIRQSINI